MGLIELLIALHFCYEMAENTGSLAAREFHCLDAIIARFNYLLYHVPGPAVLRTTCTLWSLLSRIMQVKDTRAGWSTSIA